MKISRLRATGFRAFTGTIDVDLDADVVVLSGPNGQGKTSLLDAVLWALCGRISRFQGTAEKVVSLYSPTREAEVEVDLVADGERWSILRAWDGQSERLRLAGGMETVTGRAAAVALSRLLGHPDSPENEGLAAPSLHTAITRAVYLQQDLVREFLEADDDASRYEKLSQLFGTRRVVELQVELEKQKLKWSKSLGIDKGEAQEIDDALRGLEAEIEKLQAYEGQPVEANAWSSWWGHIAGTKGDYPEPPEMSSGEAPIALDRALRTVESQKRSLERRLSELDELIAAVATIDIIPDQPVLDELASEVESKQVEREVAETHLREAEEALTESRREAAREHDDEQERALLATIALRHLGDRCPVCEQEYDKAETERRLNRVAAAKSSGPDLPSSSHVDELRGQVDAVRAALEDARQRYETAADRARRLNRFHHRLVDAGFEEVAEEPAPSWQSRLVKLRESVAESTTRLQRLQESGERLSLSIARAGEIARLDALVKERDATKKRRDELHRELDEREQTGEVAQSIIEGLRTAGQMIVSRELERIRPVAQRMYSAIDPHPALRQIDLSATMFRGRGRVSTTVQDPEAETGSEQPQQVLSSSQMNALALSIFLALNIGARDLPLHTLILDDPLQSLDDINLLGLVDLLRRLSDRRQLILSTHDARFSSLLERKLRPVRPDGRTLTISVDSWTREGPAIRVQEVQRPRDLFVVA